MSGSRDLEGVGCQIAHFSANYNGAAEVAVCVGGVCPLSMVVEREDRCERAGLETWKVSMAALMR